MSTASKSPRRVAAVALETGNRTLPRYSHRFSRHDYTLPQLFACLVLRKFFRTDYRGITQILEDLPALRADLGLAKPPHFTTLQKAERRLLRDAQVRRLLTQTIDLFHGRGPAPPGPRRTADAVDLVAVDATGFQTDHASRYFVRRRSRSPSLWQTSTYRRFGKLGIAVDCDNHLILATCRGRGPRPDVDQLRPLRRGFCDGAAPETLLADAGYDSEANHRLLREELGITSLIPPRHGRPSDKLPAGRWRCLMALDFDEEAYAQRGQAETVMFMLKRHQGPALTARQHPARRREMGLMAITHNVMIVLQKEGFYRALPTPFLPCRNAARHQASVTDARRPYLILVLRESGPHLLPADTPPELQHLDTWPKAPIRLI